VTAPLSMQGTLRAERASDHPQASPFRPGRAGDGCDTTLGMDSALGHVRPRRSLAGSRSDQSPDLRLTWRSTLVFGRLSCKSSSVNPIEQEPPDHDAVIERFAELCSVDERIVAAFLGGSHARGEADEYSDLDLCLITTDDAYEDVVSDREAIIDQLGEPLFLEDFGHEDLLFFILADGTEAELFFGRESGLQEIHDVGPFRILLDKKEILANAEFPVREPDRAEQIEALRRLLHWFWHDLSHLIAALGRGQLWWAYGQLEALRRYCVNLIRIEQNVEAQEEAYEKLDLSISTSRLSALQKTLCPMESRAMLRAAVEILNFYRERAPVVASAYGLTYPAELERLMCNRLDPLVQDLR
jgi:predicted nucleotidyltransferase